MKPQEAWNAAYHQLELQLDRASFDTWLRAAVFLRCEADTFTIGVHNSTARDMLQHRLYRNIHRVLTDILGRDATLCFEVSKEPAIASEAPLADDMPLFKFMAQQAPVVEAPALYEFVQTPRQPELPESELNPRYCFDRFIVNKSNQVVYEAARAVAEYPATVYNPFLVYGGVGLGKTHLLQSIAHACNQRGLRTIYIPSEVFTNDLVNAIRNRTTAMFREKYRLVDVLLVDDIQFISGKETTQEEFFHTFNALVNFNKQIVLASDRHPRELATLEDRLRSRFQGGLVADIQAPEYETRLGILHMWAQERGIQLPEDVIEMIASRVPNNNVRELEGFFNQVAAQTRLAGTTMSLPRAESALQRYTEQRGRIRLSDLIDIAARKQGLSAEDLMGKSRAARINHSRQIAMYLAREITDYSLPQIGAAFGGRSHTTVLHGWNKITEELAYDHALEACINKILRSIQRGE